MSLLNRCLCHLRIALVATLVVVGAVSVPAIAQANDSDLQPPVETSETTVPEPVETELPESPSEVPELPVTNPENPAAPVNPAPTKTAPAKPAIPAPNLPAPSSPAPAQTVPTSVDSGTGKNGSSLPAEEALVLEIEDAKEPITAPSEGASPSASPTPSATSSSSAAPTAVPSDTQTEESETVMSSSRFPGGPTAAQWLMIGMLLALGFLYLRFMRGGAKHMTSPEVQPASETGK